MFKCLIQIIQIYSFGILKSPNIPRQLASVGNDCIKMTGINGSPTKGQTTQGQTTLGQTAKIVKCATKGKTTKGKTT